jgi:mono/diheme cytochrome c family protein
MQNSAMPTWGEWMPIENRWNVIKYLQDAVIANFPAQVTKIEPPKPIPSVYGDGAVAANFVTLSKQNWIDEGHSIDTKHGSDLYAQYCAECHGKDGKGNGPGTTQHGIPSPAPFPAKMGENYIYWRVWDGVDGTMMYPFKVVLSDADVWDLVTYMVGGSSTTSSSGGG